MKKCFAIAFVLAFSAGALPAAFSQGGGMMGPGMGFMGYQGHPVDNNLVIPQMAVGEHYTTRLVLTNLGNVQQISWMPSQNLVTTGKVLFYNSEGLPLPVSINGGAPLSELSFSLGPAATSAFDLTLAGPDTSGWALIDVDVAAGGAGWGMMDGQAMTGAMRLMATVQYVYQDSSQPGSRVGVTPSVYEMGRFFHSITPVQQSAGADLSTGLAIVNTGDSSADIQLDLRDESGNLFARRQMTLAAGHQTAQYVHQLIDAVPADFQGTLSVSTEDDGVVVMGLLLSRGIMTSIPTMHYGHITMGP